MLLHSLLRFLALSLPCFPPQFLTALPLSPCLLLLLHLHFQSPLSLRLFVLQEKDGISNIHFKFSYWFTNLSLNTSCFLNPYIEHPLLTSTVTLFPPLLSKIWGGGDSGPTHSPVNASHILFQVQLG